MTIRDREKRIQQYEAKQERAERDSKWHLGTCEYHALRRRVWHLWRIDIGLHNHDVMQAIADIVDEWEGVCVYGQGRPLLLAQCGQVATSMKAA